MFGPSVGTTAGWLAVAHPLLVFFSGYLLTETTFCAMLLVALLATAEWLKTPRRARALGAGLLWGLAALTRPTALPLPVLVVEQSAVAYDVATFQEHEKRCEAHAREVLQAFADKAKAAGVTFDGQFVITDSVQDAIVETAKRQGCDLIVMATHGRHGLDALIHGSLTKSVLAHSQVPLLVLHG